MAVGVGVERNTAADTARAGVVHGAVIIVVAGDAVADRLRLACAGTLIADAVVALVGGTRTITR